MGANPTTTNGVSTPTRTAPYKGSPQLAAASNNASNTAKLAQLNKAAHSGGATQEVAVIKPIYKSTFSGNQDPVAQQQGNAATANKTYVQSQGDSVPLVKGGKRGSKKKGIKRKGSKRNKKAKGTKRSRSKRSTKRRR